VVECWDTNTMTWATEWDDTNSIPPVVRLTFSMGSRTSDGMEGPAETTTRMVALPSSTLPAAVQAPLH